jgi:hypothetical protein
MLSQENGVFHIEAAILPPVSQRKHSGKQLYEPPTLIPNPPVHFLIVAKPSSLLFVELHPLHNKLPPHPTRCGSCSSS